MKKNVYALLTLLSALLLFTACEGPAGENGAIGPQGAKGNTGPKGNIGEINVMALGWSPVTKADHLSRYDAEGLYTATGFTGGGLDNLTQKEINDGVILMYMRPVSDRTKVISVPTVIDYGHVSENLQLSYYFIAGPKRADLFIELSKPADVTKLFRDEEYRFIIIPNTGGARLNNVDLTNYEQVKQALNLKD
ncbi:collagen-like protein [Emticicia sp. C21]|uniref:collagen-like triple helix repeat-containing protein n=1 Tax=Emticicia sp. C21 TaxID=2302915 RepID=UPI000E3416BC|nr:collagen-like protein [Emticicia sp. C21]RFS17150.1 collagen-like protein [Emticicia sp. C21]